MNRHGFPLSAGDPEDRYADGTLKTYYGPTPWYSDPGTLWHYGCDGWVIEDDDGEVCMGCGAWTERAVSR